MSNFKTQKSILAKLGITALNPMQKEAQQVIQNNSETVLLSPTGTGKTLAFLLPIIAELNPAIEEVQALIIVPTRELAIQIEQVIRDMGTGYKTNAVYGGRSGSKDRLELKHRPAILIGTPGRLDDHFYREEFDTTHIKTLVLDEFDKSLEIGFENEMINIIYCLKNLKKKILTSATFGVKIPKFVKLQNPSQIDYLDEEGPRLTILKIEASEKNKLKTLVKTLNQIGNQPGIIFCNFKDSIAEVGDFLQRNGIDHTEFHGGMEQVDRERALLKFRNGTYQLLLATDLAARGIDIPEITFIIHYQLPHKEEEFTHRNGRTGRMKKEGNAYVLYHESERLPDFIEPYPDTTFDETIGWQPTEWATLRITGGRKDKISKGDIAGLLLKQGNLAKEDLGIIELKQDCAFVSVRRTKMNQAIALTNNTRLKKKKVRISEI
jgi:superfamily II DNA/RNA helicase